MTEPTTNAPPPSTSSSKSKARSKLLLLLLRLGLLAGGITVLVLLIEHAGPDQVLAVLMQAAIWLPLLIFLEAAWISLDIFVIRSLYGDAGKRVPAWAYIRAALIAYPFMALLPAGRAGAEAARAAALSRWVGGPRAAAAAAQGQACMLLANGLWSIPVVIGIAIIFSIGHLLTIGVAINMIAGLLIGALILLALKGLRLGGKLGKIFDKLAKGGHAFDQHLREKKRFRWPIAYATFGRGIQWVQYTVFVVAIGGVLSVEAGMLSHGIHLFGAMVGDLVPNQVGIVDGAYAFFASDAYSYFGFASVEVAAAAVLTIELLRRVCQIFWSLIGALVPFVWRVRDEDLHTFEREVVLAEQATEHPVEALDEIAKEEEEAPRSEGSASGD